MAGYTKLFSTIVTSTIWQEPLETKVLWITMLALANKDGIVEGSIPGLGRMAGLTIEQTEKALLTLKSPDTYSRSKELDGVRVHEVEGGWSLVNHAKYRALMGIEERREYLRQKQAEFRERQKKPRKQLSTKVNNVSDKSTRSTHAEADSEAKAEAYPIPPEWLVFPWANWLDYRKERKLPAYVPRGAKAQISRLVKMGQAKALASIETSIAQNWQGIIEQTDNGHHKPTNSNLTGAAATAAEQRRQAF